MVLDKRTDTPLISVIMGIRNCATTLPAAIESLLSQTYSNWELVMCDDCSTDNTYQVAETYRNKYPDRIVLLKNDENCYLAYSLNRCLEKAKGYYIARMDGDDISRPTRFEKQVNYLQSHPNIQLVGTLMEQFNEKGTIAIRYNDEFPNKYSLRSGGVFFHATIMTYKYVYEKLGGYTVALRTRRGQDYDLWFRFFAAGFSGVNIQEPLYLVREDENAVKRRTFIARWRSFRTTCIGYSLLGFPKRWLISEFIETLVKSVTPPMAQYYLRRRQQKKNTKHKNNTQKMKNIHSE